MIRRFELYAAGLSASAAILHGLAAPEHLAEWWGYGAFFIAATVTQGGYAILLALQPWRYDATGALAPGHGGRAGRASYLVGIAGTAAIVILYVVTRTIGIPLLGPEAGKVEELTPISVLSKLVELALIYLLVRLVRGFRTATPGAP
ncbi:MAG: hypothetical protein ACR2H0_09215 [Candidatus Limnocylindrales bacterium]